MGRFQAWLARMISELLDLTPNEGEIQRQRWASLVRTKGLPCEDWPSIYRAELEEARESDDTVVSATLESVMEADGGLWAASEPAIHEVWTREANRARNTDDAAMKKATLLKVLEARQALYARLRQETFYRAKILVTCLISLILGVVMLLTAICWVTEEPLSRTRNAALALCAGWMGGSFTWLLRNRKLVETATLASLREISRWPYTAFRAGFGAVSALILFIILSAGILPNATSRLFDGEATSEETARAVEVLRGILSAQDGSQEAALARFRNEVRFAHRAGAAVRWDAGDNVWLEHLGLSKKPVESYSIREALRRTSDAFWMMVLLCILAGFSETLVVGVMESTLKKLSGLGG
ncbi:MAG: hypothetical protein JNK48_07285 [Bryobacterales bacterium]|nr:hypothetical protein [Bryobacterales bacterium]